MKTIKLNNKGIIHHLVIIIVAVVVAVSAIGVGVYEYANSSSHKSHAAGWSIVGMFNGDKVFACSTSVNGAYGNLERVGAYSNGGGLVLLTFQGGNVVQSAYVAPGTMGYIWASKNLNETVQVYGGISEVAELGTGTNWPWQNLAYC